MRFLVSVVFVVSLMFGQNIEASPREDAEYIAGIVFSENNRAKRLQIIAGLFAAFFTQKLKVNSVKVVDLQRFAEMIPVSVIEQWDMRWRKIYVDDYLKYYTDAELVQIATALRRLIEESGTTQIDYATIFSVEGFNGLDFSLSGVRINFGIRASLPKLNDAPYLADILETDGIFHFPNRIWRKDFIAKIRGGD